MEVETATLFDRPRTKDGSCQTELVCAIDSPTVIAAAGKTNPGGPRCWGRRETEAGVESSEEEEDTTPAQEIPEKADDSTQWESDSECEGMTSSL